MTDTQTERVMRIRAEWEVELGEEDLTAILDKEGYRELLDLPDDELEWEFLAKKDSHRVVTALAVICYQHARIQVAVKRVPLPEAEPEEEVSPEEAEAAGHPS